MQIKSKFFCLIETILFDSEFKNLNLHLDRLEKSAEYFKFKFKRDTIILLLQNLKLSDANFKVRILLDSDGSIKIQTSEVNEIDNFTLTFSRRRTSSSNIFYYHKTTNRELYNNELKKAGKKGFYDIIFFNEKDELTEGAITNIYIKKGKDIFTPPVSCGLLNGIIRRLEIKKKGIIEKIILPEDLIAADTVYISNSIIGFREAEIDAGCKY